MEKELSEMHNTKIERVGYAKVIATHLPTGTIAIAEGKNRQQAKLLAYAEVAQKLGMVVAANRYKQEANNANL